MGQKSANPNMGQALDMIPADCGSNTLPHIIHFTDWWWLQILILETAPFTLESSCTQERHRQVQARTAIRRGSVRLRLGQSANQGGTSCPCDGNEQADMQIGQMSACGVWPARWFSTLKASTFWITLAAFSQVVASAERRSL